MTKFRITKQEFKRRAGYILLGFFAFYLVEPLRTWADENIPLSPLAIGLVGMILTLYFFEF